MTDSFALIDCISDCCIVVNGKGVVEKCNDAIQELTGYSKVELAGKSINTLIQSEFHNQHDLLLQNYFSGPKKRKMGAGQSIHCVHKNETLIPVEISLNPVEVNGQLKGSCFLKIDLSIKSMSIRSMGFISTI